MSSPFSSKTSLPSIFSDGLVLQRNSEVTIWGWDRPGEKISVTGTWDDKKIRTKTNSDSCWWVKLKTPSAGGPFKIMIRGSNGILLNEVLIGEVWLCSGQSNMEWSARMGIDNGAQEIQEADYETIRLFKVKRNSADVPQLDCEGVWTRCTPASMKDFSAVAYFFGRHLFNNIKMPIGLIDSSWDGTPIEDWMNPKIIYDSEEFSTAFAKFPDLPWCPSGPGLTYNAMIVPLIPYKIAGVIWYQGETNTLNPIEYRRLFPALIANWRQVWREEFPFYYVQIGPYKYDKPFAGVLIREAQQMASSIPNTGMVVISDIVSNDDIHPKNKKDVGIRLANWALSSTYGKQDIPVSGPLFKDMKIEGNKIHVFFDYAENGLICKGENLTHFQIAGKDKKFVNARADIEGSSVLTHSKDIDKPLAVRFAWSNSAIPNLFNVEGLPASCFRTDDWEIELY